MKTKILAISTLCLMVIWGASYAMAKEPVKVGVITVLSGPLAIIGKGEADAAKMAVEEYGAVLGEKVELIIKDHAYSPGLAVERAKELYEKEKVDVIIACPNSAAALGVSDQAFKNKRLFISTSAGTTDLIARNPYTIKWNYNDYMLATTVGLWGAEHLGKRWYTITADYAWGHDLLKHFTTALKKKGGEHLGNDMVAVGTADYSPYILKAAKANPDVLVLLNVGKDAVNSTKAAVEYGLKKKAKIVHALLFEVDIKGAGIDLFTDNYVAASWNWQVDNPGAREFADRFYKRFGDRPHFMAAGVYSATWQYLEAVKRAGSKEQVAVIKALRNHTFRDMFANPGFIRAEDHLQIGKAYLLRVKKAADVKEKEDFFEIAGTLSAEEAHPPVNFFGRKVGEF
ncbi:MAG: hypothetical protein A2026_13285 [Deltaproteobacteria bacterium RBG_19FT_COMBO_46_12]|nr:MAG: hypothetical protein A2026_13285 [Deltaproteobacteria bacterium RBG_19FT_COMBO_46_12]